MVLKPGGGKLRAYMFSFAYLDPGTGSLVLQALVAGAAGVAVFWRQLTRRFRKPKAGESDVEATETDEPVPNTTD